MRILLIDHYDSFTWNVVDWLRRDPRRPQVEVLPYDGPASAVAQALLHATALVISPGPKRPEDAPQTLELLARQLGKMPILGVCLGHQMLATLAGANIVTAREPWHGTTRTIRPLRKDGLFRGMPECFEAAIYNSLVATPTTEPWSVDAVCPLGEVQAISYRPSGGAPAFGVQFHPESHLSEKASILCANWLDACEA